MVPCRTCRALPSRAVPRRAAPGRDASGVGARNRGEIEPPGQIGIGERGFVPRFPSHTTGQAGPHPAVRWFIDRRGEVHRAGRSTKSAERFEGHHALPSPTSVKREPPPRE